MAKSRKRRVVRAVNGGGGSGSRLTEWIGELAAGVVGRLAAALGPNRPAPVPVPVRTNYPQIRRLP
jgi:hypothetical protein